MTHFPLRNTKLFALTALSASTVSAASVFALELPARIETPQSWQIAQAAPGQDANGTAANPDADANSTPGRKRGDGQSRQRRPDGDESRTDGAPRGGGKTPVVDAPIVKPPVTKPPVATAPITPPVQAPVVDAPAVKPPSVKPAIVNAPPAKTTVPPSAAQVTPSPVQVQPSAAPPPMNPTTGRPMQVQSTAPRNPLGAQPRNRQIPPPATTAEPVAPPTTMPAGALTTAPAVRTLEQAKSGRQERSEDGGKRTVIREADKRTIVRQGNRVVIQKDEAAQMKRVEPNARVTRNQFGTNTSVVDRPNNVQVVTETDRNGQIMRRFRRDRDGRETAIFDNRRKKSNFGRNVAIGVGVGAGIVAGAAILNSVVDVPAPVVRVPRDKYIVRYEDASEEDVYEALNAPPVELSDRRYTLDQVRATPHLRERMRRVDLDDINFETGSWDVNPAEYRKLERIARAMNRVIARNPNEVFMIEGYTDAVGSVVDNLTLSDRRAESVSVVLSEQFDVPFENLTTQGYGEEYLKIETDGPERANRRVAARRITPLLSQDKYSAAPPPPPRRDPPGRDYDDRRAYDDRRDYDDRDDERPPPRRWRNYDRYNDNN